MLLALRSTSCVAASENAIRELVGLAMSNPSELVHGRDMALPRSCCYWPYGQGEAATRGYDFQGIAAWKAWAEKHQSAIVGMGGPLGKTKKVSEQGIEDISNLMSAYTVVRVESHDAAA